ncbi:MAG: dihydroxy-acid dehydratase, partial [SAR202 cluster bacterium]|nr:dihydroxy-acid dehydratase [SAR202 cluster bacterium]
MEQSTGKLRSQEWFDTPELYGWLRRAAFMAEGHTHDAFEGKPVIGICNTWSELTHCNSHLRGLAEAVKRGVWQAGGFPMEFPVMSLGEYNMRPTTMLFRNLMSMDVEESIRANPLDGVVLLGGCDKTTPALLMGATSADVPAILVTGG